MGQCALHMSLLLHAHATLLLQSKLQAACMANQHALFYHNGITHLGHRQTQTQAQAQTGTGTGCVIACIRVPCLPSFHIAQT